MLSFGPPLLHANTGRFIYIHSTGTIPKCSFSGVYNTAYVVYNSWDLSLFEILNLNVTLSKTLSSLAKASNSL